MQLILRHLWFACVGAVALLLAGLGPAEAFNVYYLSVGNAQYQDSRLEIPDANLSARQMTRLLRQLGAVDGITLLSEEGAYVTNDDLVGALKEVAGNAQSAGDPLVVYYFIGHGRTLEPGGDHVSLTGSYRPPEPGAKALESGMIETRDVQKLLEEYELPYMLILDNCYFREPTVGLHAFGRAVSDKLIEQGNIISRLPSGIENRGEPRIILYAAKPGEVVQTLPHPLSDRYAIGPLARRLLLLLNDAAVSEQGLSMGRFLGQMSDPRFDPASVVGHSSIQDSDPNKALFPARGSAEPAEITNGIRRGSGGGNG